MTLRVGVTGGIGSGKSALTARLQAHGITVVDADLAARVVVQPGKPALAQIRERFGDHVILEDGNLNRPEMRRIVFADPAARAALEAITHPKIREELLSQMQAARSAYVVLSSPLLFESGQAAMIDKVVVVDVPESVQVARTMSRDQNDEALVRQIMAAQLPRADRLAKADMVIDNSGSEADLLTAADELHSTLLRLAGQAIND